MLVKARQEQSVMIVPKLDNACVQRDDNPWTARMEGKPLDTAGLMIKNLN